MTQLVRDLMTTNPVTMPPGTPVRDAARAMREQDIGDVLVAEDGRLRGIVTDRDIVVRAIAEGRDPDTPIGEFASRDVRTLTPDSSVEDAIQIARDDEVRRIPVVQDGRPVGIISLGDLAIERDSDSALADISAASPNN
jgi:CBS domain-containing protein